MTGAVEYILMCEQCYEIFYNKDATKIICKICNEIDDWDSEFEEE
jgi:formylmethanofuran dehydrogenase subunit E